MSSFSTCCVVVLYHAASFFTCCVVVLHAMSWLSTLCRRPLFCRCLSLLCHRPHCCVIVLIAVSSSSLLCHRPHCCVIVLIAVSSSSLLCHRALFLRPLRFLLCQPLPAPSLSRFLEEGFKPYVIQRPSSRRISLPVLSSFVTPDQSSRSPSSRRSSRPPSSRRSSRPSFVTPDQSSRSPSSRRSSRPPSSRRSSRPPSSRRSSRLPSSRRISLPVLLRHAGSVFPSSFILPFCQEDSVVCASHWRPSAIKLRFSALMMMMK